MPIKIKPIILIAISVLIILFLLQGNILKTASADESDNGSTIAGVKVSGLNEDEMKDVLQQAINQWVTESMVVSDGGQEVTVDPSQFVFDIEGTVEQYEKTVEKPWFVFWETDQVVHLPLQITVPEEVKSTIAEVPSWDVDATLNSITTQASYLKEHEIKAVLNEVTQIDNERIALSIENIPNEAIGVQDVVDRLNATILYPGETFSFIGKVGESNASREAKNFVASLLYDAVLNTEFEIVERHSQEQIPAYLEPGINAAINIQYNEDLQFLNSSTSAVQINATVQGSDLKVEIYSNEKSKEVLVQIHKEEISPRIINRYSQDLLPGQKQLVQEGVKGIRAVVTRIISESGSTTEEQISRDYYAPTNRIVLVSASQEESGTTAPNSSTGTPGTVDPNATPNNNETEDPDTQMDLDNNDLPDMPIDDDVEDENQNQDEYIDEEDLPEGSYYDKGGNLITP